MKKRIEDPFFDAFFRIMDSQPWRVKKPRFAVMRTLS